MLIYKIMITLNCTKVMCYASAITENRWLLISWKRHIFIFFKNEQKAHGPHHIPEKPVLINKHVWAELWLNLVISYRRSEEKSRRSSLWEVYDWNLPSDFEENFQISSLYFAFSLFSALKETFGQVSLIWAQWYF